MNPPPVELIHGPYPDRLASVFRELRKGRHLCRADGQDYYDLERGEELYRQILHALGYELIHHPQGFYFVTGGVRSLTDRLHRLTLFVLILFRHLEDTKFQEPERSWERHLLGREFRISELPHFDTAQRRTLLDEMEITPATIQDKVIKVLAQLGFIERRGPDSFMFRPPIYRFVDLFLKYAEDPQFGGAGSTGTADAVAADAESTSIDDQADEDSDGEVLP